MMSEPRHDRKVTLEDVLRLKRAERPASDFWASFERELRTRQLAAAVEKRRWWFGLPRVWVGAARYQLPVGAAAALTVAFLTLRDYREPGFEMQREIPVAGAPSSGTDLANEDSAADAADAFINVAATVDAPITLPEVSNRIATTTTTTSRIERAAAEPRSTFTSTETAGEAMSPSARSIAANLAAIEPELADTGFSLARLLPGSTTNTREPLAQVSSPRDARRERLFAYQTELASYSSDKDFRAGERIGGRISDEELYDSVRRLSAGGDRLTVRF